MKKRVNISLDEYILKELDLLASEHGIDRSAMISVLVAQKVGFRTDKEALEYLGGFENYIE